MLVNEEQMRMTSQINQMNLTISKALGDFKSTIAAGDAAAAKSKAEEDKI